MPLKTIEAVNCEQCNSLLNKAEDYYYVLETARIYQHTSSNTQQHPRAATDVVLCSPQCVQDFLCPKNF